MPFQYPSFTPPTPPNPRGPQRQGGYGLNQAFMAARQPKPKPQPTPATGVGAQPQTDMGNPLTGIPSAQPGQIPYLPNGQNNFQSATITGPRIQPTPPAPAPPSPFVARSSIAPHSFPTQGQPQQQQSATITGQRLQPTPPSPMTPPFDPSNIYPLQEQPSFAELAFQRQGMQFINPLQQMMAMRPGGY